MKHPSFSGHFETHITVEINSDTIEHFKHICAILKLKPILIELQNGAILSQLMTAKESKGDFEDIKKEAYDVTKKLNDYGFKCIRIKIEASPFNKDIPITDEESLQYPDAYFEYHVKTLFDPNYQEIAVQLSKSLNAHLSNNAFKVRNDGLVEKFFTKKMYLTGKNNAINIAKEMSDKIQQSSFLVELNNILEYCIYDTNILLDEDWLEI